MVNRAAQRVVGGRTPADQRFAFDAGTMRAAVLVIRNVTYIRKREIELSRATAELHGRVQ